MAFFSLTVAKERLNIASADTADDTLINNLGAGADQEVASELRKVAKKMSKLRALPEVDVTNALVGGVAVPQSLKDASTNRCVSAYHAIHNNKDGSDLWLARSDAAIKGYIEELEIDNPITGVIV